VTEFYTFFGVGLVLVVLGIGFTVYHFKTGDTDAIPFMLYFSISGIFLLFIVYTNYYTGINSDKMNDVLSISQKGCVDKKFINDVLEDGKITMYEYDDLKKESEECRERKAVEKILEEVR